MNQADNRFSNHIKAVFGELDQVWSDHLATDHNRLDFGNPDHGWEELRKKYPAKRSKRITYLWSSGIAASLLIAGMLIFYNKPVNNGLPPHTEQSSKAAGSAGPASPIFPDPDFSQEATSAVRISAINQAHGRIKRDPIVRSEPLAIIPDPGASPKDSLFTEEKAVASKQPVVSDIVVRPNAAIASVTKSDSIETAVSTIDFLKKEKNNPQDNKDVASRKQTDRTSFDVYTATFLNYYGDNPTDVNAGGGINANFRISKQFYLSMGAGISENKISYQTDRPSSLSGSASNIVLNNGDIVPITGSQLDARFLNIDLPVAIKFYPGKSGRYYISTGINSSTYLNQKYSTSFNYYSQSYGPVSDKSEEIDFKGFDFASSAIFAIGINQQLGKNSIITFEPFFKPALKGVGEKNFKIHTAGLSLKLGFGNKK